MWYEIFVLSKRTWSEVHKGEPCSPQVDGVIQNQKNSDKRYGTSEGYAED